MGKDALNGETVKITKLVNGGQGIGRLSDQKVVFVWNALPGETVKLRIIKNKRSYAEAIADEIIEPSPNRVVPKDKAYLATSPWQILSEEVEAKAKIDITKELFAPLDMLEPNKISFHRSKKQWHYRNKMEYSFWGDEDGLHLALHQRGSRLKQIVEGSALAQPELDKAALALVAALRDVRASSLKTVVLRSNREGMVAASLFVKDEHFKQVHLPSGLDGLKIYFSNPKSPASVMTKLLSEEGKTMLSDTVLNHQLFYDADSFFQVNLGVFEAALAKIKEEVDGEAAVDMYSGVGSIGLCLDLKKVILIELNELSAAYAVRNASSLGINAEVRNVSSESALDAIPNDKVVIFDPPRAGLHTKLIDAVLEKIPPKVIYLSCNPATLARDVGLLGAGYRLKSLDVYNFFPKTPHIESLAILEAKA